MCFLVSIAVICTFILTLTLCYPLFFEHTKQEVKDEATYLTYVFNHHLTDPKELLKDAQTQTRITWIDPKAMLSLIIVLNQIKWKIIFCVKKYKLPKK